MVYLWFGRVHASDTQRMLEVNTGRGDMKRLIGEVTARHVGRLWRPTGQSVKRSGQVRWERRRGTGSVGPRKRNGRKGVGTQGRRYAVVTIFGYGVKPSETNKSRMCNIAHALRK